MMVYDNGSYRQATQAELDAWAEIPPPDTTEADKAEAYDILMGGAP